MKETGLMFKAPLVRAVLSGQKTQTRRVVKDRKGTFPFGDNWDLAAVRSNYGDPYGQPGDRIYVRETFVQGYEVDPATGALRTWDEEGNDVPKTTWYRATDPGLTWSDDGESEVNTPWKPAIHMPKDVARIWLEVTGLRVERLQTISRGDAMAEGCPFPNMADGADPRKWFAELWNSTTDRPPLPKNENSKRYARVKHWLETHPDTTGWEANPWVWVIDFKRIEKPR